MLMKILKYLVYIIGAAVVLLLLALLTGFLVDMATYPSIKNNSKKALQELKSQVKEGDNNAWNYYLKAADELGDQSFSNNLQNYLKGGKELNDEIQDEINRHQDVLKSVAEGARQPFCSVPYEYEKGWKAPVPNFLKLQMLSRLNAGVALGLLKNGKTEESFKTMLTGLVFGQHLLSSAPILINYMVGLVITGIDLTVLNPAVASGSLSKKQLDTLSLVLENFEQNMPLLAWAYEGDLSNMKIGFASASFFNPVDLDLLFSSDDNSIPKRIIMRFMLWRHLFSIRLAAINSMKVWDRILPTIANTECRFIGKQLVDATKGFYSDEQIRKYVSQNLMFELISPGVTSLKRKEGMLTKVRLLRLAALVWAHRLATNRFPGSLAEIKTDSLAVVDPMQGAMWHYVDFGDSAAIISPGPDHNYNSPDDIYLVLKKSGIKKYQDEMKARKGPPLPKDED